MQNSSAQPSGGERNEAAILALAQEKEAFMSKVRHDLKTPLANLKLAAQYLTRKYRKGDLQDIEKYLTEITAQVDALTKLINELSEASKSGHD